GTYASQGFWSPVVRRPIAGPIRIGSLLTVKQVAARLGVSAATVYGLCERRECTTCASRTRSGSRRTPLRRSLARWLLPHPSDPDAEIRRYARRDCGMRMRPVGILRDAVPRHPARDGDVAAQSGAAPIRHDVRHLRGTSAKEDLRAPFDLTA